jgi:hypothetical protein
MPGGPGAQRRTAAEPHILMARMYSALGAICRSRCAIAAACRCMPAVVTDDTTVRADEVIGAVTARWEALNAAVSAQGVRAPVWSLVGLVRVAVRDLVQFGAVGFDGVDVAAEVIAAVAEDDLLSVR